MNGALQSFVTVLECNWLLLRLLKGVAINSQGVAKVSNTASLPNRAISSIHAECQAIYRRAQYLNSITLFRVKLYRNVISDGLPIMFVSRYEKVSVAVKRNLFNYHIIYVNIVSNQTRRLFWGRINMGTLIAHRAYSRQYDENNSQYQNRNYYHYKAPSSGGSVLPGRLSVVIASHSLMAVNGTSPFSSSVLYHALPKSRGHL